MQVNSHQQTIAFLTANGKYILICLKWMELLTKCNPFNLTGKIGSRQLMEFCQFSSKVIHNKMQRYE